MPAALRWGLMTPETRTAAPLPVMLVARVFAPFAAGYFLSYVFRTVNAVIAPDLVRDFGVTAGQLGLLTSTYFLTFAAAQLPLGMLLDRFGPQRVNVALLALAAAGALAFAWASSYPQLVAARAVIGLGVSGALMASFKAFTAWFPPRRLATVNGLLMAIGGLGALASTAPIESLLAHTTWRGVFNLLAAATLATGAAIAALVPSTARRAGPPESFAALVGGVAKVYRDAEFRRIGLACLMIQGGFLAVQGLWAGPWLADVAGLARGAVAQFLFWMALATTAGFAFFGNAADRFAHLGLDAPRLFRVAAVAATAALGLMASGVRTVALPACLLFAFAGTGLTLSYAILSRRFPLELVGRAHTAVNLMAFVGAFGLQWGLGLAIGLWAPEAGHHPPQAYAVSFGVLAAAQAAVLVPLFRRPRP